MGSDILLCIGRFSSLLTVGDLTNTLVFLLLPRLFGHVIVSMALIGAELSAQVLNDSNDS